ncbi:uncharacterized protein L969DRAFT_17335 [Mixia osmundae IAM 14324]|uniref:uncharacterized protein n=1 Tax=Mixia osmundae (strain CBS 9802 / IAM 14324 / JCM 22182 / KY 12970) TaxID=764103 RepID=UPI0004A55767|nr:uncharacterized protein L969DRAFT_17335 [Mixia osmundae IAM 14324]KEI39413.1 hypothetical protein L969DRAFT_17335 [Mixia osmundae IAM 14324]
MPSRALSPDPRFFTQQIVTLLQHSSRQTHYLDSHRTSPQQQANEATDTMKFLSAPSIAISSLVLAQSILALSDQPLHDLLGRDGLLDQLHQASPLAFPGKLKRVRRHALSQVERDCRHGGGGGYHGGGGSHHCDEEQPSSTIAPTQTETQEALTVNSWIKSPCETHTVYDSTTTTLYAPWTPAQSTDDSTDIQAEVTSTSASNPLWSGRPASTMDQWSTEPTLVSDAWDTPASDAWDSGSSDSSAQPLSETSNTAATVSWTTLTSAAFTSPASAPWTTTRPWSTPDPTQTAATEPTLSSSTDATPVSSPLPTTAPALTVKCSGGGGGGGGLFGGAGGGGSCKTIEIAAASSVIQKRHYRRRSQSRRQLQKLPVAGQAARILGKRERRSLNDDTDDTEDYSDVYDFDSIEDGAIDQDDETYFDDTDILYP